MIKIKRDSGAADSGRAYKVVLDDNVIGEVDNGKEVTFDVPKGSHKLVMNIDWCSSNTVNFEMKENNVEFECGSSLRGFKIFLSFIYILFLRDQYLWLKKSE